MSATETETDTREWLGTLSLAQLRALGCQHKVEGWKGMGTTALQDALLVVDEVAEQASGYPETD